MDMIKSYLKSDDKWQRRIAVVSTVALNLKSLGGKGDAQQTLEICELSVGDNSDTVIKALFWALRELSKIHPDDVKQFIELYKLKLHKRIIIEVLKKMNTGKKN